MAKKPGRGPRKRRGGGGGRGGGGRGSHEGGGGRGAHEGGAREAGGRARHGRGKRGPAARHAAPKKSDYFMQPGRGGVFMVLRRPIGNRADPKLCGTMPSRIHAKMLIQQLERAESVVKDLFMEATDDGIEALEAVLAACCEEVLKRGPVVPAESQQRENVESSAEAGDESDAGEIEVEVDDGEDPYAPEPTPEE